MKYIFLLLSFIGLIGCSSTDSNNAVTYFGGEIINPKSNFVLFLKDNNIIDTLFLDEDNRFLKGFDAIEEGLYTFKHGPEFQYIYLKPTDSILVRLNTWDFDSSLVFTGNGSNENEFLITLFLQDEKEEREMYRFFNLDEINFERKIDSLMHERQNLFNTFVENQTYNSEKFTKLTQVAINYPLYRLKEIYPYYHKKAHDLANFPKLSGNFYNFRENVSLNEGNLVSFYPYQNYVISYLYNLSHQQKEIDSTKKNLTINILNAVVDNIQLEEFKNTLLKRIVVNDFLKSESSCSINKDVLDIFLTNCTDEASINQITNLVNDSKFIDNNKQLEDFELVSFNNLTTSINKVIHSKNAVIYFWSREFMSSDYLVKRIQHLEKQYPDVLFIGINMEPNFNDLEIEPNLKLLNTNKQYLLTRNSAAHNFLTSKYPRTILVNNKGIVTNSFTYLDSKKLGSEISNMKNNSK
jgi:thiol-disulfide isomerase/thioredoxin